MMTISTGVNKMTQRLMSALFVVMLLIVNPFATSAGQPGVVERASDAAVALTEKPRRPLNVREYVRNRASRHGWSLAQWRAVVALVNRENRSWNVYAKNREGSSAYGLFQILKTPHGTPLRKQVDRFIRYIEGRYDGDPVKAWAHWQKHGWY